MGRKKLQYSEQFTLRLDKETSKLLDDRAKVMGLGPTVVLRMIIEHSLRGPAKGGKK
jgi:hypothetical protein